MNNKTDINVQYVSPLKKICMTIGELPSSYLETMSYYEMLVWFTEFLKNQVIPTVNNNAEAVQELQSLYEELRTYVNNYFDNLDVQNEIDNKLDEMVTDGTMDQIINQEIFGQINSDISTLKEYATLSDMPTLFIGDSYTNPVQGYGEYYKAQVGLSNSKYFKYASGGAGFHATGTGGKTFIDLLNLAIAGMTSDEKESIKQIIVGCMLNDAGYSSTVTQIKDGISSFMTLVNANYPNAKVYIIACGYRVGTSQDDITARYNMDNIVMNTLLDYSTSNKQVIVIDNSNLWLRNSDWFNDDNMHPNDTGQKIIANHLVRALQGNTEVKYHEFNITLSFPKDGAETESFNITGNIMDNILNVRLTSNQRLYNLTSISGNTLQEIGTWNSKIVHTSANYALDIPVNLRIVYSGDPSDNWVTGFIRLAPNGKLYMFVNSATTFTNPSVFMFQRFHESYLMLYM